MAVKIRETREADYAQVKDLLAQEDYLPHAFTEQRFDRMLEKCRGDCYVADDEGMVVGSIFSMNNGAFLGYTGSLVVAREYRRQDIGSDLVKAVLKRFDELGISRRFALIRKENEASVELFRSLGFEIRNSHYLADMLLK